MGKCISCGEKAGLFKNEIKIKGYDSNILCPTYELICHLAAIFHDKI